MLPIGTIGLLRRTFIMHNMHIPFKNNFKQNYIDIAVVAESKVAG